jgi:hypothetical protein
VAVEEQLLGIFLLFTMRQVTAEVAVGRDSQLQVVILEEREFLVKASLAEAVRVAVLAAAELQELELLLHLTDQMALEALERVRQSQA